MPLGIQNATNTTMEQLLNISNGTDPIDFFVRVNETAFGGYYVFIAIWVIMIILYFASQDFKDQPLNNMMYASATCAILALFARTLGLLTDHQMWIFPLITIFLATAVWAIRKVPN